MNIDDYIRKLSDVAKLLDQVGLGPWESLEQLCQSRSGPVWEAIEWRRSQLVSADISRVEGYLEIGFLKGHDRETRLTFFVVALELGKELLLLNRLRICERYKRDHPIFMQKPELWKALRVTKSGESDCELLSVERLKQYLDTELFEFEGSYLELSRQLPPAMVAWARKDYPHLPTYARFDPYVCKRDRIVRLDCEMIVPPNPKWWADTSLHRGHIDGASYSLQDPPCTRETQKAFWEYHIKGIRKLEVSAIRRNSLNLSMMVEELAIESGDLVGRMIHLDSDCAPGTPAGSCALNHLDLAMNYYLGDTAQMRLSQNLSNGGKVVDASHRIHLFRIEGAKLDSLFNFADYFFESQILKNEWRTSQTKHDLKAN